MKGKILSAANQTRSNLYSTTPSTWKVRLAVLGYFLACSIRTLCVVHECDAVQRDITSGACHEASPSVAVQAKARELDPIEATERADRKDSRYIRQLHLGVMVDQGSVMKTF